MSLGYLNIVNGSVYVSKGLLINNGYEKKTLNNRLSLSRNNKSQLFNSFKDVNGTVWIEYNSIPIKLIKKLELPENSKKLRDILQTAVPNQDEESNPEIDIVFQRIKLDSQYWVEFIPIYKDFFFDIEVINNYAINHAYLQFCIIYKNNKRFTVKELFSSYKILPKTIFKTDNYSYFCNKLIFCEKNSIEEALVHSFRINGRKPYRVTPIIKSIIRAYYADKKTYSIAQIHKYVNIELKLKGLNLVSLSTVSKICNNQTLRNKVDRLRFGEKFAKDFIDPYLTRKNVKQIGDLYQIDSTRINFACKEDGVKKYLTICAIIDVCSRKIVGFSFDEKENVKLIKSAIRDAFETNELIPKHIVVDNHASYKSIEFQELTNKLKLYGINIRNAKPQNAKDKAYIESWFNVFQISYLKGTKGFLGEGIKTKRLGGRVNPELEKEYTKLKNLLEKNQLIKLIRNKIYEYNDTVHNSINDIPNRVFNRERKDLSNKFNKYDISLIFGKCKTLKIRNSMITIKSLGVKRTYTIWDRIVSNKYNRTKVNVYYDDFNLSIIHLFDLKNIHIMDLKIDKKAYPIAYTDEDIKAYQSHTIRNEIKIKKDLEEIYVEMKESREEFKLIPIVSLDKETKKKIELIKIAGDKELEQNSKVLKLSKTSNSTGSAYSGSLKVFQQEKPIKKFILEKVQLL
ncbi:transposase family protein [uncultured Lacinutrix sp.]|uniref:integrase catalytic domain-containing protein n=1 Tax=uncultured Lacinutrix sp. TaxID=574032 RepID=UPI0026343DE0|nr:transposase family protein [uncultured Lacinutrix sp.]